MKRRCYQEKTYQSVLSTPGNVCCQQDTGTGKSLVIIDLLVHYLEQGLKVAVVVPKIDLIINLSNELKKHHPNVYNYLYSPVNLQLGKPNLESRLLIGNYQSWQNYYQCVKPDIVIHDEAHHTRADTWQKLIDYWWRARHIGFTATPVRYDGKSLKNIFPKLITSETTKWFIDHGYLSKYSAWSDPETAGINISGSLSSGKDELGKQQSIFDDKKLIGDAKKTFLEKCQNKKTIVFCTGVDHAYHILESYGKNLGAVLTGKTGTDERLQLLEDFNYTNKYQFIVNIDIFTEGVDTKYCDAIQLLRFTHSPSLIRQMYGRVLRPTTPDKVGLILDHAGNLKKHDTPSFPMDWEDWYYRDDKELPPNIDLATMAFYCSNCIKPIAKMSDIKGFQAIECPHCGHPNLIKSLTTSQRKLIEENKQIDLVEYKLDDGFAKLNEIVKAKTGTNKTKINKILKLKFVEPENKIKAITTLGIDPQLAKIYVKRSK
jgi:superfamily II DNA or RNA helicase